MNASTENTHSPVTERYDAIVVGGRLAGAGAALVLARRGARVLVLERSERGADTLSTHALLRVGVIQLARWGLVGQVQATGAPPIDQVTFHHPDESFTLPVAPGPGYDGFYAPPRTMLDPIVSDAAAAAGADVRFAATVREIVRDTTGRVRGVSGIDAAGRRFEATAPIVVGADGARSMVARAVGADVERTGTNASGFAFSYFTGIEQRGYEWCFAPAGAAGLIPTAGGEMLVFAGVGSPQFREQFSAGVEDGFWSVLRQVAPAAADRVRAGRRARRFRSFPGMPGHIRSSHGPGWVLVGDAAYFKDPISAHGMSDALRDAELVADAVGEVLDGRDEHVALAEAHDRRLALSSDLFRVTDELAGHPTSTARTKELLLELSQSMEAEVAEMGGRPSLTPLVAGAA